MICTVQRMPRTVQFYTVIVVHITYGKLQYWKLSGIFLADAAREFAMPFKSQDA